ncbi:MAG TPA: OmpA family protein [Paludibacteraceae bacterium]|jgi:outer membrane protein OmpA-like peptidoglycan-associated protein|nr:OmpA family protein [Paludibacteraceae bacterium]
MRNFILFILTFLTGTLSLVAANPTASKKEIKSYETAVILINEGKYKQALPMLNKLTLDNNKFIEAYWTLADLHKKMGNIPKQISTLQRIAKEKAPRYHNTVMRLAEAYHENCNYEEAIKTYQLIPESQSSYYKKALKEIEQCKDGLELMQHPVPFEAKNMGPNINSLYDDYWPSITADEGWFSLTVKLGKMEGESEFGKGVHEDIFISKKEDGQWGKVKNAGQSMNTIGNEGAQSLSLDSRYMFFVACDRRTGLGGCDIYYCIRQGDDWSAAINPGITLNTKHWETCPSLSPTGDVLYFASNRPGGKGKSDIWKSKVTIMDNGMLQFSEPENLDPVINTEEDEFSPFIHADNHSLFFSSKGHKGLGGYDIFVTYREGNTWSKPRNLGYPINTCKDDIGFVVNAYGDKAYFSSDGQENNGQGRDIYEIKLGEGNFRPAKKMKYAKGKIVDAETKKPMQAKIDIFSIKSNETVFRSMSDKKDGEFVACVPEDEDFGIHVNKKGYLFHSDYFATRDSFKFEKKGVKMEKIEIGKKIILKNIFFDFDKFTLKKESYMELDRLVAFLKENPRVRIELSGHTDIKGSHDYNITLSENRALAAFNYLVNKGIAKNRMEHKGYGPDKPIADNATDEGRALNRRTEITIIGK